MTREGASEARVPHMFLLLVLSAAAGGAGLAVAPAAQLSANRAASTTKAAAGDGARGGDLMRRMVSAFLRKRGLAGPPLGKEFPLDDAAGSAGNYSEDPMPPRKTSSAAVTEAWVMEDETDMDSFDDNSYDGSSCPAPPAVQSRDTTGLTPGENSRFVRLQNCEPGRKGSGEDLCAYPGASLVSTSSPKALKELEDAVVNADPSFWEQQLSPEGKGKRGDEETVWVVEFFAGWCPHCQHFAPGLIALGSALRKEGSRTRVAALSCVHYYDICRKNNASTYPTVRWIYRGRDQRVRAVLQSPALVTSGQTNRRAQQASVGVRLGEFLGRLPPGYGMEADRVASLLGTAPRPNSCAEGRAVKLSAGDGKSLSAWPRPEPSTEQRLSDAGYALAHTLQDWVTPRHNTPKLLPQDVAAAHRWVFTLMRNFPLARRNLNALEQELSERKRKKESICLEEWRELTQPLVDGWPKAEGGCGTETCRLWQLFHVLAVGATQRRGVGTEETLHSVFEFIRLFFRCSDCRRHALDEFHDGKFGFDRARKDGKELLLYFWRFHNAVSERLATERNCSQSVSRHWPPADVCADCPDGSRGLLSFLRTAFWPAAGAEED